MSCFFFYFKPMGLYSGGLIHGLILTLVTGLGLYEDGLILRWANSWQFVVISKALINSNISHDKFFSINNVVKEYDDMKEEINNSNDK